MERAHLKTFHVEAEDQGWQFFYVSSSIISLVLNLIPGGGRDDVFKMNTMKQLTYTNSGPSVTIPRGHSSGITNQSQMIGLCIK